MEKGKNIIKLYYEEQYRMYSWNTQNKLVQTNLNMKYLDSRYKKPRVLLWIYLLKGQKKGRLIA